MKTFALRSLPVAALLAFSVASHSAMAADAISNVGGTTATSVNTTGTVGGGTGTTTIGNTDTTSSTVIQSGTGGVSMTSGASSITTVNGTNTVTGTTNVNASANYNTNINTGTSTGSVVVGNTGVNGQTVSMYSGVASSNVLTNTSNTMSGGSSTATATHLLLDDNGATFSQGPNGAPTQVHGVADGTAPYDAVNVRQLQNLDKNLSGGIASVAAMSAVPQVDVGKKFAIGLGSSFYNDQAGVALGVGVRIAENWTGRASFGMAPSAPETRPSGAVGVGYSW